MASPPFYEIEISFKYTMFFIIYYDVAVSFPHQIFPAIFLLTPHPNVVVANGDNLPAVPPAPPCSHKNDRSFFWPPWYCPSLKSIGPIDGGLGASGVYLWENFDFVGSCCSVSIHHTSTSLIMGSIFIYYIALHSATCMDRVMEITFCDWYVSLLLRI